MVIALWRSVQERARWLVTGDDVVLRQESLSSSFLSSADNCSTSIWRVRVRGNTQLSERPIWELNSVQSLSRVQLFVTSWTAAHQASLSIANSQSILKLMSIESVMPSDHLILCQPLLLPPSVFPSIRVFSNESVLPIRWPKYWSLFQHQSFEWIFGIDFLYYWLVGSPVKGLSKVFSNTTVQKHKLFGTQLSL